MADITITEGDTLEVDYNLENTGDGTGTFDPRLFVQGTQEDQDTGITLDPAQTATGTLQWPTESGDAVTDALAEAVTDDTSDSITVTVEDAIPDSVVSRDADNNSNSTTDSSGITIETSVEWPEIGAELSSNVGPTGPTRARVIRVSDGQVMGQTDISGLVGGDTFTIDLDTDLVSGETYNFVVDAEGGSYDQGFNDSPSFPYTSTDGNLSITAGANGETSTTQANVRNIVTVGNVGF